MAKIRNPIIMVGGGTDVSDTTAVASDVLSGKDFYLANGTKTTGTIQTYSGSTTITQNGTVATSGKYLSSDLTVSVGGGASITNSQDVTENAVASISANTYVEKLEYSLNDPSTSGSTLGSYSRINVGNNRILTFNGTYIALWKCENKNMQLLSNTYTSMGGGSATTMTKIIQNNATDFIAFGVYHTTYRYIYYQKFTISNDTISLVGNAVTPGRFSVQTIYGFDAIKMDTDIYCVATTGTTFYISIIDTSGGTILGTTTYSPANSTYARNNLRFVKASSTYAMAIVGYSQYEMRMIKIYYDAVTPTVSQSALSGTVVAPNPASAQGINYLSFVKELDSQNVLVIYGGYGALYTFNNDFTSVTSSWAFSTGKASWYWFYNEYATNKFLIASTDGANDGNRYKDFIMITINNDFSVTVDYESRVSDSSKYVTFSFGNVMLIDNNGLFVFPYYQSYGSFVGIIDWYIGMDNNTPYWLKGVTPLSSNSSTIYGVTKTSASTNQSITVMIPNVT